MYTADLDPSAEVRSKRKSSLCAMREERSKFLVVMSGQPKVSAASELSGGSSAGRKGVLVGVSFAVIGDDNHKQLRGERVYFSIQLSGHSPLLMEVRAGTQAGT